MDQHELLPGLPLWIVENGLCNRVRNGRSYPRPDGWDRPRYLTEHVAAVVDAVASGAPVTAYLHWSLVDNYEWGTYEPRFGIFGIDRARGPRGFRWLDTDAMGQGLGRRLSAAHRLGARRGAGHTAGSDRDAMNTSPEPTACRQPCCGGRLDRVSAMADGGDRARRSV